MIDIGSKGMGVSRIARTEMTHAVIAYATTFRTYATAADTIVSSI